MSQHEIRKLSNPVLYFIRSTILYFKILQLLLYYAILKSTALYCNVLHLTQEPQTSIPLSSLITSCKYKKNLSQCHMKSIWNMKLIMTLSRYVYCETCEKLI